MFCDFAIDRENFHKFFCYSSQCPQICSPNGIKNFFQTSPADGLIFIFSQHFLLFSLHSSITKFKFDNVNSFPLLQIALYCIEIIQALLFLGTKQISYILTSRSSVSHIILTISHFMLASQQINSTIFQPCTFFKINSIFISFFAFMPSLFIE